MKTRKPAGPNVLGEAVTGTELVSQPHLDEISIVQTPRDLMGTLVKCLGVTLLAMVAAVYVWLAKVTTLDNQWLVLDMLEAIKLFGVDDAYRFYIAKAAGVQPGIFSWNYALPVGVVLDNMAATLFGNNLFLMRCFHIVPAFMTLWFVYKTGEQLGVSKGINVFSPLVLACMPLYALVFLSFYGESWLTFFFSAAMCAFAFRRYLLCAAIASLMPLIRAEGFFLIVFLALFFLKERQWKCFITLGSPGGLYFLWLLFSLDSLSDYFTWRLTLRKAMNVEFYEAYFVNNTLSSFNLMWIGPALLAFWFTGFRRMWPIWGGAMVWLIWLSVTLAQKYTYYEARYLLSILPVISVAFAYAMTALSKTPVFIKARTGLNFLMGVLILLVISEHFFQVDALRAKYAGGERWPVNGPRPIVNQFWRFSPEEMQAPKETTRVLYSLLARYPLVDALVINKSDIFYYLDPRRIPPGVTVSFSNDRDYMALIYFKGYFFTMHPGGKQYSIYRFRTWAGEQKRAALYVGQLRCKRCEPVYKFNEQYQVYMFWYEPGDLKTYENLIEAATPKR